MTFRSQDVGHHLVGKTIFMSASVPAPERHEEYLRVHNAAFEIDQAVISLTRAVLSASGALVFGGHPSISPLVATVAAEYREPVLAESTRGRKRSSIHIYQSEAYRDFEPRETSMLYELGYAELQWIESFAGERFDPEAKSASQCLESLRLMRSRMIEQSQPDAMVCIGGMDGVEREVELFAQLRPRAPIFVLAMTGGAAHLLSGKRNDVTVMDVPIVQRLRARRLRQAEDQQAQVQNREDSPVVPYPLIMQMIVDRVARGAQLAPEEPRSTE